MPGESLYCTFWVGPRLCGIALSEVREVTREAPVARVPLAAPAVVGLTNLRGRIVTVIDLRTRLGITGHPPSPAPMHVFVEDGDGIVSLVVDRVGDVVTLSSSNLASADVATGTKVKGIGQLPGALLHVLDVPAVLDFASGESCA